MDELGSGVFVWQGSAPLMASTALRSLSDPLIPEDLADMMEAGPGTASQVRG